LHGYASFTPVTDGKTVYVYWGRSGAAAYDLQGRRLWIKDLGSNAHHYGSAASPILAGNLLIVNASIESGTLFGLDKKTGEVAWKANGIADSRSTPAVIKLANGKEELVLSMKNKTLGVDPLTGKLLWTCDSAPTHVVPMTVVDGDVVFITGGRTPITMAIRGGGRGDVTETHRLWKIRESSTISSPLVSDGLLYWVDRAGIAGCFDAKTGKEIYMARTGLGRVYASLVMAEGRLYCVSRTKGAIVYTAGREFKELARNELGDESVFDGTPVIHNSQLLLRSKKFLYCIGK
jgi:outer membrane protein assembly factor BamB